VPVADPSTDQEQLECSQQSVGPFYELSRTPDHGVAPHASATRTLARDALPFEGIVGLPSSEIGERQVVPVNGGFLVALDAGEWGGGLFFVSGSTRRATRVDTPDQVIRRIARLSFGMVGISGLCHGESCSLKTAIFQIRQPSPDEWRLTLLRRLDGCPGTVSVAPGDAALLVASCGKLYRITATAATVVARWPNTLIAIGAEAAPERARRGTGAAGPPRHPVRPCQIHDPLTYYVTFGRLVARFAPASRPAWFAPSTCSRLALTHDGHCTCALVDPAAQ
jgi:hypothetical protein